MLNGTNSISRDGLAKVTYIVVILISALVIYYIVKGGKRPKRPTQNDFGE